MRIFNRAAARGISEAYDEKAITDGFLEEIRHNNEVFAAFRTHSMQNAIARQMTDDKGQLKSFHQFRKDVEPLTGKYCDQWLNTEYNTAIIRAHRAADWKHFEAEKDVYPNLRWMPTTSANPDPVHARFWTQKLTLPVDDPFWDHHHPGERWGCKCTCEQTDEPVNDLGVTEDKTETASRGLKGNPGVTGKLFSEDHPYFPKDCGRCPFNSGATNVMKRFFNVKKDCSECKACVDKIDATQKQPGNNLSKLIENVKANRTVGETAQLGEIPKNLCSRIESEFNISLETNLLSISDKRIAHALRASKALDGRGVNESEFINELLSIDKLEIYLESPSKRSIYFVQQHGQYFNKYVFKMNYKSKKGKSVQNEFITAGRIDIRNLSCYKKIK